MRYLRARSTILLALVTGPAGSPAHAQAGGSQYAEPHACTPASLEGTLVLRSEDRNLAFQFDPRVFIDAALYQEDKNRLSNGSELRRGRFAITALLRQEWLAQFDIDLADNAIEVRDAWISYTGRRRSLVRVGNFKEPFSLEELTSSRYITFMERALPNALAPGRHLGVGYTICGARWQFTTGLFGEEIGDTDRRDDEGYGVTARLTFAPLQRERRTVHLGLAASYRTPQADSARPDRVRFHSRPEAHVDRIRFLTTGRVANVHNVVLYGLEAATVFGPVSLQGEYIRTRVNRKSGNPDAGFDGAYGFISWFVTGEARAYVPQEREFGRITPRRRSGAWELAARYSTLDLNEPSAQITGGRANNITAGLNWYANANIRVMVNYVVVNHDGNATGGGTALGDDDFRVWQTRFQVNF
ncbi:MAG: OprO/OprP family phosphate-selective porin [Gemmatimonadaceae bacterium]